MSDLIRDAIAKAEVLANPTEVSFIRPEGELIMKSCDLVAFESIRSKLPVDARMRLAGDYELYKSVEALLGQIRSIAAQYVHSSDGDVGPLALKLINFGVRPPSSWRVCGYCRGTGEHAQFDKCDTCGGDGYVI